MELTRTQVQCECLQVLELEPLQVLDSNVRKGMRVLQKLEPSVSNETAFKGSNAELLLPEALSPPTFHAPKQSAYVYVPMEGTSGHWLHPRVLGGK